jgi:hypothetical protein
MKHLRGLVPALVTLAALLGFVGVSAALEGEPVSSDGPAVTCPDTTETTEPVTETTESVTETTESVTETTESTAPSDDEVTSDDQGEDGGCAEDPEVDEPDTEAPEVEQPEVDDESDTPTTEADNTEHPDNHGAAVSQAAHDCPAGSGHGECVSAVAHSDAGKHVDGDDEGDDSDVEAPETDEQETTDVGAQEGTHGGDHAGKGHTDH